MTAPEPGPIEVAAAALLEALRTVPGLRVYDDPGATIDPPGAVLGPPQLLWESYSAAPSSARFLVVVAVPLDDRALPRLWQLAPLVVMAVDTVPDAVVRRADPSVWAGTAGDLPAYEIQVEIGL